MSRNYGFTAWEEPRPDMDKCKYVIYGREICPKTGKEHFQGYGEFARRTYAMAGAKRILGVPDGTHLYPRRGTREQMRDYCRKDGEFREFGVWESLTKEDLFKQPIGFLKENYPEFYCRYHKGLEKLQTKESPEWRDLTVTVLWGEPERFKSRRARVCDSWYCVESPYKWFDGYTNQKRLILDDFILEDIGHNKLKRLLDGYPLQLETKGGFTHAHWTEVVITTNEKPKDWFREVKGLKRRCHKVIECTETKWEDVTL